MRSPPAHDSIFNHSADAFPWYSPPTTASASPLPSGPDRDGDHCSDAAEVDDDNDGIADAADACPQGEIGWTSSTATDHDGDGCRDAGEDGDDDDDGVADQSDACAVGTVGWTSTPGTDRDGDGCQDLGEDPDSDDDGLLDPGDRCEFLFGPGPSGCPTVSRRLTLGYGRQRSRFRGQVLSPATPACATAAVRIFRRRRGPDRLVAIRHSQPGGRFAARIPAAPGHYYARVGLRVIDDIGRCAAARSPTIEVG